MRYNYDNNYFNDIYQSIPINGYTNMFNNMLSDKLIKVKYNVDYFEIKSQIPEDTQIIYTGPIDRFFNYKYGKLEWRTVSFEKEYFDQQDVLGNAVINYSDIKNPYTRIHEFKHYHKERESFNNNASFVMSEKSYFATGDEDPYYPINTSKNKVIFKKYEEETKLLKNTIIDGRLGSYKYWDMHHCIAKALSIFENRIQNKVTLT